MGADGVDLLLGQAVRQRQAAVVLDVLPQFFYVLGRRGTVGVTVLRQPADEIIQLRGIHAHLCGEGVYPLLVGIGVGIQLGFGVGQLLFGGIQLRQAVIILLQPGLVLGLAFLKLFAGGFQLGGVGSQFFLARLQLRFGITQLGFGIGQLSRAVVELCFVGGQFVQAVQILALTVIDFFLAVGQLLSAVGQFGGSISQLLVGFGLGVVVLGPGVVKLSACVGDDAVIPRFAPRIGNGFDVGLDRVDVGLVDVAQAVLFKRAGGGQVDLGVGLVGKILLWDVENQLDCAIAHAGGLALEAEIVGVVYDAHDGILGCVELGVKVLVGFAHHQSGADGIGLLLSGAGFYDALAGCLRQAALDEIEPVDGVIVRRGQAVCSADDGVTVCFNQQVCRVTRLHLAHTIDPAERRDVLVGQAQGGDNAQVVEVAIVHITFHRLFHVDGCGVEPGQKADAQCHDGKHGGKTADGIFKRPQGIFAIAACHLPFDPFHGGGVGVHGLIDHPAAVDAYDPVRHGGQGAVVGDDDDGAALFAAGGLQQRQHLLAGFVVQRAGGFIAQQDLRVFGQCAGDGNALLLTARKLRREVVFAVRQTDLLQYGIGVQRVTADLGRKLNIFARSQVLHQIVKLEHKTDIVAAVGGQAFFVKAADSLAVQQNGALVTGIHAAQHIEHGGFARARGAQDHAELAFLNFKAHMVGRRDAGLAHLVIFTHVVKQHKRLRHAKTLLFYRYRFSIADLAENVVKDF